MTSYFRWTVMLTSLWLAAGPAYGQHVPAATDTMVIRLDALVAEALQANPSLQASRARWQASRARPPQVGALPDPTATFTEMSDGTPVPFGNLGDKIFSWYGLTFTQSIPFPGKRGLRGDYARQDAVKHEHDAGTAALQVAAQVKLAYYDLYYIDRALDIIASDQELLEQFERIANTKYTVGQGHQEAVLRAQLELSLLNEQIITLSQQRNSAIARLNALRNRPPDTPLPGKTVSASPVAFDYTLEDLLQEATARAPQLRAREALIDRETVGVQLARRAYYPDFTVMATYLTRPQLTDMWEIKAGVSLPLYYRSKQRSGVAEAQATLEAARMDYQAERQELTFAVKDAYLEINAAGRLIDLYGTVVVPQATLAVESALSGYQVGSVDFLTALNDFKTLLDYELRYHRQAAVYHQGLARLEAVTGMSLWR